MAIPVFKIEGQNTSPFKNPESLVINAIFGTEPQPSIDLGAIDFCDDAENLNSTKIRQLISNDPTKGGLFSIGVGAHDFGFYFDNPSVVFKSDVVTSINVIKDESLDQFDRRAEGITQRLLIYKHVLQSQDFTNVPFIVKNRKTDLEKLQILQQSFNILKSIADEVHKIINIASDLPTLGTAIALINLAVTVAAIVLLFNQLFDMFLAIQETFFPPIKYHAGLKPKTFIEKAVVNYMGYDSVDYGSHPAHVSGLPFNELMNQLTWCGSKNQQRGFPALLTFQPLFLRDGVFNPSDNGYYLDQTINILIDQFRLRKAIINNVLHLRPENDPFWTNQSGYTLPDVKVEQIFANNGTISPNYNEVYANTIIEYQTDDSDKWTLDDLIDELDPDTTGKIISVKTLESTTANNKRSVLNQGKSVVIPHTLAVRNSPIDELMDLFVGSSELLELLKSEIQDRLNQFANELSTSFPQVAIFVDAIENRTGVMKIENEEFSVPKQMLLVENSNGFPTIPIDFADKIGAKALMLNYHSWDSFIPGQRIPSSPETTAAKYNYNGIKIPFGEADFATILNNAYFTTINGKIGKFTRLSWNVMGDYADVDYWIYENWMKNIEEDIV